MHNAKCIMHNKAALWYELDVAILHERGVLWNTKVSLRYGAAPLCIMHFAFCIKSSLIQHYAFCIMN